ncbi:hypothetical protein, partial [Gilliamella sp. Gris1-4]|uniref:hypothetical protein n=1 Tax=Gilliamella sp. Gris1-4 TaxID=3120244 RepID=UPI00159EE886
LPVACCLLPVACCLLPVACCLLPVACCLLPVACCLLPVAKHGNAFLFPCQVFYCFFSIFISVRFIFERFIA